MELKAPKATPQHAVCAIKTEVDLIKLLVWAAEQEGLVVAIVARSGVNDVMVQMEGMEIPTLSVSLPDLIGQYVTFDGHAFRVLAEEEFAQIY